MRVDMRACHTIFSAIGLLSPDASLSGYPIDS